MSNFTQDIRDVCDIVTKTAGDIGMTIDTLATSKDLLQRYGDEREKAMEEMLELLSEDDTSRITDAWKSKCDTLGRLLSDLDERIPKSPMGEGLDGIGAKNFREGEEIAWKECIKGEIPFRADVIAKVYKADLELMDDCSEQLKKINSDDKVIEQLMKDNLISGKSQLTDTVKFFLNKLAAQEFTSWMKNGDAQRFFRQWSENIAKMLLDNMKAAEQKAALKDTVLKTMDTLNKTKDQLSKEWIQKMYEEGAVFARNLHEVAEHSDYKAADWSAFGEQCVKELEEWRNHAKEVSEQVYNEILPQYIEKDSKDFAAMSDDPSWLASWKSDMRDQFKALTDAVIQGNKDINEVTEGSFKRAAIDTFSQVKSMIEAGNRLWLDQIQSAEDKMKK